MLVVWLFGLLFIVNVLATAALWIIRDVERTQ
jgi:hypothetical protein